jgi:hypothetical protein
MYPFLPLIWIYCLHVRGGEYIHPVTLLLYSQSTIYQQEISSSYIPSHLYPSHHPRTVNQTLTPPSGCASIYALRIHLRSFLTR